MTTKEELLQQAADKLESSIKDNVQDIKHKEVREYLIDRVSRDLVSSFKPFLEDIKTGFKESLGDIKISAPVQLPEIKIPAMPEIKTPIIPPIVIPEIKLPTINVPEIKIPEIKVPPIKLPTINVPKPEVTVNVPPIKVPDIIMPDEMNVKGWVSLMGVNLENPLPVQLRDAKGNPVNIFESLTQIVSGGSGSGRRGIQDTKELPIPDPKYAPLNSDSTVLENGKIVKPGAGILYGITGYNNSGAALFIQIHNTTTQPAEGAVPIITMRAAATNNFSWDAGRFGKYFSTGITIVTSTTVDTKTLNSSADCWFNTLYI